MFSPAAFGAVMRLLQLEIEAFRCLDSLTMRPDPVLSVVRGKNAQGKTSLLEAVVYTTTSKSHRTTSDDELVLRGAEQFRTRIVAERDGREVVLEAFWWNGAKRFRVNGVSQTRVSDILGKINVVLFTPDDTALVRGSGSIRRRFLDMEISQVSPRYLGALQQYRHVLRQRNELLRRGNATGDLLAPWDEQLVTHGTAVIEERASFVAELAPLARDAYAELADGETLSVVYEPDAPPGDELRRVITESRATDIRRGQTNRGPHRDDVELVVAGLPARSHASQGQQKSASLALKLAEVSLLRQRTGEYPVLLLDEVFAELDQTRGQRLLGAIPEGVQSIVTTTVVEGDRIDFGGREKSFMIAAGTLTPLA